MNTFNYFFTPVGPEYKKKFARNVGIAVVILFAFYGVMNLIGDISEPKLENNASQVIELFNNNPEVKAFHMQYQDAQTSLRDDHISYFSGSDDGYLVRMNLYFDENFSVNNIDFHCYYQKVHQFELPQDDLTSKIEKYDCKEHAFEDVSSIPSAKEFLQMDCEDLNHHYPEFPSEEVADAWITRMHECLNEQENAN